MKQLRKLLVMIVVLSLALVAYWLGRTDKPAGLKNEGGQAAFVAERIVSVDASATEILFALGVGDQVIGRDQTSIYPPQALKRPSVGGHRHLSSEGILQLKPTLVIGSDRIQPPSLVEQLKTAGVEVFLIKKEPTAEGARRKIQKIAARMHRVERGKELIQILNNDLKELDRRLAERDVKIAPRVLSLYLRGTQTTFMMGRDSGMVGLAERSGGASCLPELRQPRMLNAEALVAAKPEVFLLFRSGLDSVGGVEGLLALPGVAQTSAGKNRRIIALDGVLMSSFGPRMGKAALELFEAMYERKGLYISEVGTE